MACPKCALRALRHPSTPKPPTTQTHRTFSTTPSRNRLGAFTYAQEFQTGTYHYNKSLLPTLPLTAQRVDNLLTAYATQTRARTNLDRSNPVSAQIARANITAQRRAPERVFISKSTAKDFGDRVEVQAFVFDGFEAAVAEQEARRAKKMGVRPGQGQGEGGGGEGNARRGPTRRRIGGSGGGGAGAGGEGTPTGFGNGPPRGRTGGFPPRNGAGGPGRSTSPPRSGFGGNASGNGVRTGGGAGAGRGETEFRSLGNIGSRSSDS